MKDFSRILVRGVNWLGDAVMSTPALMRLRAANPEAHIALLTPEKLAELWQGQSFLDETILFSKTDGVGAVSKRLQAGQFDLALIFPNSFRSALEVWLTGIPARVGYCGNGRGPLLSRKIERLSTEIPMRKKSSAEVRRLVQQDPTRSRETFPSSDHHIFPYLRLVAELGANPEPLEPRIEVSAVDRIAFRSRFELLAEPRPVIGINPGAEYGPAKRWPLERFIATAVELEPHFHPVWVVFGAKADAAAGGQFEKELRGAAPTTSVLNLTGQTSLRELCAGLSLCDVVLTNDTGPMHLAAAVGTRVVVPFGSTAPELTGPGLPGSKAHDLILGKAPCAPCFRRVCPIDFRCMTSILVADAAQRLSNALLTRPGSRQT